MPNKIQGPELSQDQINTINTIKTFEAEVLEILGIIREQKEMPYDARWLSIGITDLEKGFMSIVKGIATGV